MENNDLEKKIIEKVRNRVVISNLESEENMKLNKKKQILSLLVVMAITLTGSFITVNATTNENFVKKITDTIKVVFVKENGEEQEVKGNTYTDSNNHTIEKYEIENDGASLTLEVDKNNLDAANLVINETMKDGEAHITIENRE